MISFDQTKARTFIQQLQLKEGVLDAWVPGSPPDQKLNEVTFDIKVTVRFLANYLSQYPELKHGHTGAEQPITEQNKAEQEMYIKAKLLGEQIRDAMEHYQGKHPQYSEEDQNKEAALLFSLAMRTIHALHGTVDEDELFFLDESDLIKIKAFDSLHDNEKNALRAENLRLLGEEGAALIGKAWVPAAAGSTTLGDITLSNVGWAALGVVAVMLVASGVLLAVAATGGAGIVPIAAIAAYCGFGLTGAILAGTPLAVGAATMLAGSTVLAGATVAAGAGVYAGGSVAGKEDKVAGATRAFTSSLSKQSMFQVVDDATEAHQTPATGGSFKSKV